MARSPVGTLTPDQLSGTAQVPALAPPPVPRQRAAPPAGIDPAGIEVALAEAAALDEAALEVAALDGGSRVSRPGVDPLVVTVHLMIDTALALAIAVFVVPLGGLAIEVGLAAALAWPLLLLSGGHYRKRALGETRTRRVRALLGTGARGAVLALAASPWLTAVNVIALAQMVAACSVASGVHHLFAGPQHRPRLVLAGRQRDLREAILELDAAGSHEVVAVCLARSSRTTFGDLPTYVGLDAAAVVAGRHDADALVVLPGARLAPTEMRRLHWALAGVGVELCVGTGLLDVTPTRTRVFSTGGLTLVRAVPPSLHGPRRWVKEVVERIAATTGLLLLLPVLLALGVLVRLDSAGPAIYPQQRVGRDGRHFTMYKFRSMSTSADAERIVLAAANQADGVLFKIRQDPRVTRLGRWLRRSSLDELPQLWNVVRGEMSLVGPRPALPEEVALYDLDPRRRLVVKPGMTGLWQVSGRSDLTWAESVRLDVRYVDNWSLGLDLSILVRTFRAVLGSRGAY